MMAPDGSTVWSRARAKTIPVIQGEFEVSGDPDVVLTTVLGSCVSVCLFDPIVGVGGMNHFLLPAPAGSGDRTGMKYGTQAMEMLINSLIKKGAGSDGLQAKVFGGARMLGNGRDIGSDNALFARDFLKSEGIDCLGESLGGDRARRVQFHPATGAARQKFASRSEIHEDLTIAQGTAKVSSDVELF